MSVTTGKRKHYQLRSSSAEPELVTTKRFLINKEDPQKYHYKTLSSSFFICEDHCDGFARVDFVGERVYTQTAELKKPLINLVNEDKFLNILDQNLKFYGEPGVFKEEEPTNIDKYLHGIKKDLKYANL